MLKLGLGSLRVRVRGSRMPSGEGLVGLYPSGFRCWLELFPAVGTDLPPLFFILPYLSRVAQGICSPQVGCLRTCLIDLDTPVY